MPTIESLIQGSDRLTDVFGYWPSFHDAEVLELHFCRGNVDLDQGRYDFPVLTAKLHLWELTCGVNQALILRHHTLATLRFFDVDGFRMEGFNHQNATLGLSISQEERDESPSPYFKVHFDPAFGMGASFTCLRIELADVTPCGEDGHPR
jgi:Immunity protein 50